MIQLVKAELYKYSRRKFMYVFQLVLIMLMAIIVLGAKGIINIDIIKFTGITKIELLRFLSIGLQMILNIMLVFGVVINEDYREGTIKNVLSSQFTRTQIFFSKFITQIILAYILAIVSTIVFIPMFMSLEPGVGYSTGLLKDFIFRFCVCTIPYIGGIAIVNFLSVVIKRQSIVCIIYYFIFTWVGPVFFILNKTCWDGFAKVQKLFLSYNVGSMCRTFLPWKSIYTTLFVGMVYTIIFTTIAVLIYRKQEI